MESVNQVKEALSAKSRTATLDELRSEGRKKVRLIKAEHVAAMIATAVTSAIEQSGMLPPAEVERLVEKSRAEFKNVMQERQAELHRSSEVEASLQTRDREITVLRDELQKLQRQLAATEREVVASKKGTLMAAVSSSGTLSEGAPTTEVLQALVQEVTSLKANLGQNQQATPVAAAAAPGADFTAAIEKLAGTLNDRLEKFGKKMGVSAAVEAADVKFDGMFKDEGKQLESNMDNIVVKQKSGGGIAANLARLKKLKGS